MANCAKVLEAFDSQLRKSKEIDCTAEIDALNQDLPVLIKSSNAEVRTSAYFMCQCITAIVSFLILPLAICADLFLIYPMQISFQFLHTKDLEIFSQQYA
jgi:hypothetical protein